jgi:acetyl-CoA acyltransferase
MARVLGMACRGGGAPRSWESDRCDASQKVLARTGLRIDQMDVIELNEAFAAQGLATLRALGG